MIIGIIENNKIINVLVFDDFATAEEMFPTQELVDLTDPITTHGFNLGVNWYKENNIWYPPKPTEDYTEWIEEFHAWATPEEYSKYLASRS